MRAPKEISSEQLNKEYVVTKTVKEKLDFVAINHNSTIKKYPTIETNIANNNVINLFQNGTEEKEVRNEEIIQLDSGEKVKLFFTNDQDLRNQYYALREKCFREEDEEYRKKCPQDCLDWEDYDGSENKDDRAGRIIVVTNEAGKVVAGMRLVMSDEVDYTLNEEPLNGFTIKGFLEKMGLDHSMKYSETDDAIIDEHYRCKSILNRMFINAVEESKNFGCKYVFGLAIKSAARNHKIVLHRAGYDLKILLTHPWPKQKNHGYETRYPCVASL